VTLLGSPRLLVVFLLLGVVVVGFGQGLNVERASGVITSYSTITAYSTWTSTSYYYYDRTSISTEFKRTTVTALTQKQLRGPYVNMTVVRAVGSTDGVFFVELLLEVRITNLMSLPIIKGKIVYLVFNSARTVTEEAFATFFEIKPSDTILLKATYLVTKRFPIGDTYYSFERAEVECAGITTEMPFATYTYSQRFTETHLRTYTSAYTKVSTILTEELSAFLNTQTILVLVVVAAVAVAAVVFVKIRKPSAPPAPPTVPLTPAAQPPVTQTPSPPVTQATIKYCMICGGELPSTASHCTKCGTKQES